MDTGSASAPTPARPAKRRRWTLKRLATWFVLLLAGALIAGEIGSRAILGLGDPPLFQLDPDIEYLLRPNGRYRRFGHDVVVNQWSMRAGEFGKAKGPNELRVLAIGDSILYGGGKIDQSELATEQLRKDFESQVKPGITITVGNASAPSWGPPNQLAYVKRFGLFDADVVVLVLNSDDVADVPGLEYVGSAWPREKPVLALQELVQVYIWKALCAKLGRPFEPPGVHTPDPIQDEAACHRAFDDLVALVRQSGAKVALVQYLKKSELAGAPQPGYTAIHAWAVHDGVPALSTGESFGAAMKSGAEVFLDDIHPTAKGQELLAEVLANAVREATPAWASPPDPASPAPASHP